MVRTPVDLVVDTFIGNPFLGEPHGRRAAEAALASMNVARELEHLIADGHTARAKLLLLAVGHAQACDSAAAPAHVLDAATVPPSVARKLPRRVADYRRVALAAGRAFAQLASIRGSSSLLQHTRRATWAACFGSSLRHALELEPVIRDHDVLILGETGTGKESFARAIQHATPGDADGGMAPSAAINAAAIPDALVESELFGHVKGAFTGASDTRAGRLRSAHGGSFFLDEVGDLPTTTQVKLLRVIETDEVFPVGSDTAHPADVRYIAATHKDLEAMVRSGEFRRDLFERLAGNVIRIPPLRDRPEDIQEIGEHFVRDYLGDQHQLGPIGDWLSSRAARSYPWPGNVRELQNALRNLILGLGPELGHESSSPLPARGPDDVPASVRERSATMQSVERWYLQAVLDSQAGNLSQAARILGLDRSTVRRRLRD
ncbi:MAG TPA: sigma 54-interacting transcriptional regulator [Kofleriaceae bacterium]|nr:sigma 54-interacting transcriptional regulator [Kofleriaceae bacterium]